MTSHTHTHTPALDRPTAPDRTWQWVGAGTALAVSVAYTELWAVASGNEENPVRASLVVFGVSLVTTAIVFTLAPRLGRRGALVLGILAALTSVAVWFGAPIVLAVAAVATAWHLAQGPAGWRPIALRASAALGILSLVAQLVLVVMF